MGDLRVGGGGLGDGERLAHRLFVELGAERGEEEPGGEQDDPDGDGQLRGQHLGEDASGPADPHTGHLCLPVPGTLAELTVPIHVTVNAR